MLRLEIVAPDGQIFSDDVDEIVALGIEGHFGVLPGHVPFITLLDIGEFIYKKEGKSQFMFVNSGYAEVNHDKITILAESAEFVEQIDIARAEEAKKRAEERLRLKKEGTDFKRSEAALERALNRIQLSRKHEPS